MSIQSEIMQDYLSDNYFKAIKTLPAETREVLEKHQFYRKIFYPDLLKEEIDNDYELIELVEKKIINLDKEKPLKPEEYIGKF